MRQNAFDSLPETTVGVKDPGQSVCPKSCTRSRKIKKNTHRCYKTNKFLGALEI